MTASAGDFGPRYLDDLELLREAHRQIGSRIPAEHIPSLAGLPEQWRVTPTGKDGNAKRPFLPRWNEDLAQFFVPLQLLSTNGVVLQTAIGVGVLTGPASGGLLVIDFDALAGDPESAEREFQRLFGRPSSDLPCTAVNVSGRPGRKKVYLQVPEYWWPLLGNASLKLPLLDVMWLNTTGHPRQAVIAGDHPESTPAEPLVYRWLPERHPALVGVEIAPLWFLVQLIHLLRTKAEGLEQPSEEGVSSAHTPGEEGPRPMDLLSPGKQLALLRSMAKHWPYRGGTDCADPLGRKGHWPVMCRLVLSIWRGIDSEAVFSDWMVGSAWDKRNDWAGRTKGTCAVNGNALLPFVKSLVRSKSTEHQQVEPWAAAWAIAIENGWKPPEWALPPRATASNDDQATAEMRQDAYREWDKARRVELALSDVFPGVLADLLQARADAFPVAPSAMLAPVLTTLASVLGKRYRVKVKGGHTQPMVLWMGNVSAPGTLKSPVGEQVIAPLRQLEREGWAQYKAERKEYHATPADDRGPSPIPPRAYLVQDCTIEGLSELLKDNDRTPGVLGYYDELAGFFGGMDAYRARGASKDRPYWLSAWSCHSYSILRKGSPPVFVEDPAVSLFGCIQPDKLVELVHGDGAESKAGDGFWSRFLWVQPPYVFPKTNWDEVTITAELRTIIDRLTEVLPGTTFVDLAPGARDVFERTADHYADMSRDTYPTREAVLNKLRGYLARFAGLLHAIWFVVEAEQPLSGMVQPISEETMERAALLCDFLLAQFDALAPELGGSSLPGWVTKVIKLAEQNEERLVRHRDLVVKKWADDGAAAREMLTRLVTQFGLGQLVPTGRADSVTWHLPEQDA